MNFIYNIYPIKIKMKKLPKKLRNKQTEYFLDGYWIFKIGDSFYFIRK
jgi:hypothetical protein